MIVFSHTLYMATPCGTSHSYCYNSVKYLTSIYLNPKPVAILKVGYCPPQRNLVSILLYIQIFRKSFVIGNKLAISSDSFNSKIHDNSNSHCGEANLCKISRFDGSISFRSWNGATNWYILGLFWGKSTFENVFHRIFWW